MDIQIVSSDATSYSPILKLVLAQFQTIQPKMYKHYKENQNAVHESDPTLRRVFDNSVFSGFSINWGPANTNDHTDNGNFAGNCIVSVVGDFDDRRGGHMTLWDLGIFIRFPSGCSMMLPSALLRHSTVPVQAGETRYSLVQYTSSGLFRWMENGRKSDAELLPSLSNREKAEWQKRRENRWREHLKLFSLWEDFVSKS